MTEMNINEEIGKMLTKFKNVEYDLNCIIGNFVSAKEYAFFDNVILNSGVMPTANKIKVIKTICNTKGEKYDFSKLHKLLDLRNLFAHENYYMESSEEGLLATIDVFKNGKYEIKKFQEKVKEFQDLYKEVSKEIMDLNSKLAKKS